MAAKMFQILGTTFKRFNEDRCFNHSIVISYLCLLCAIPLIALFAQSGAQIRRVSLGQTDLEDVFIEFAKGTDSDMGLRL